MKICIIKINRYDHHNLDKLSAPTLVTRLINDVVQNSIGSSNDDPVNFTGTVYYDWFLVFSVFD